MTTSKRTTSADAVSAGSPARRPRRTSATHSRKTVEPTVAPPTDTIDREAIAALAYSFWVERGCVGGSPEEDWLRAERELLERA